MLPAKTPATSAVFSTLTILVIFISLNLRAGVTLASRNAGSPLVALRVYQPLTTDGRKQLENGHSEPANQTPSNISRGLPSSPGQKTRLRRSVSPNIWAMREDAEQAASREVKGP